MMKFRKPTLPNFLYSDSYYQSIKRSNNLGFFLGPIYTTLVYYYMGVGSVFYGSLVLFVFFGFTYFQFKRDWHKEYLPYQFVLYFSVYMFLCLQESMLVNPGEEFTFSIWAMSFIVCCQSYYAAQVSVVFILIHLINIIGFQFFYGISFEVAIPYYIFVFFTGVMSMTYNVGYAKFSSVIEKEKEVRDIVINNIIDGLGLYNIQKGEIEEYNSRFYELIGSLNKSDVTDSFSRFLGQNDVDIKLSERGTYKKNIFLNTGECYDVYITDSQLDETLYKVIRIADISNTKYLTSEITRYENRVNRLEQYYEQIFNSSQDLILILSKEGVILSCNKSVQKLLGWKEVEIEGTYVYDTIDEQRELLNLVRAGNMDAKESKPQEITLISKNGRKYVFEVLVSTAAFADEDSILISGRNISGRKKIEAQLKSTVDTYLGVINNIDAAVYHSEATDIKGRSIKFVSRQIEQLFGLGREDFVTYFKSEKFQDLFINADYEKLEYAVSRAIDTVTPQTVSYSVKVKGVVKSIEEKMYPKKSDDGTVFIYGILEDKTSEIELNTKFEKLVDNYKDLLDNLPDPAIVLSGGSVVYVNDIARDKFGSDDKVLQFLSNSCLDINADDIGYSHFDFHSKSYSVKHIPFLQWAEKKVLFLVYENKENTDYLMQLTSENKIKVEGLNTKVTELEIELDLYKRIVDESDTPLVLVTKDKEVVYVNNAFKGIAIKGELNYNTILEYNSNLDSDRLKTFILPSGIQVFEYSNSQQEVIEEVPEVMHNALIKASGSLMIWSINKQHILTGYNEIFERIFVKEFGKAPVVGMNVQDHVKWVTQSEQDYTRLVTAIELGWDGIASDLILKTSEKLDHKDVELFVSPVVTDKGEVEALSFISNDISERITSENKLLESIAEKEVLLKEVHHRVKNNLQVISSILSLQANFIEDEDTREILKDSQNRINSMSFIHESLYQRKSFAGINFSDYLSNLSSNLVRSYGYDNRKNVNLELEIQPEVELSLDQSIPCGLILNEIISNALKYAFTNTEDPKITIILSMENRDISFIIADNGSGMKGEIDIENSESLGMQLIHTLVEQLEGNIELISHKGMKYLITFTKES